MRGKPVLGLIQDTGTGSEVWYIRDERARDREVLHLQGGVLYKSGVYAFSWKLNRRISDKYLKRFKDRVREITRRVRGRRIEVIVKELRQYMLGWQAYFNITQVRHILRKLGVSRDLAWNTAKSAHGPWRLSRSPGLAFALTAKYFAVLGLPRLFVKPT